VSELIHEEARDVPVVHSCDVCVVGGSCTGVFAAVRAARLGASATVVEQNGFFGGVATAGLVNVWHTTLNTTFDRQIIGGMTTEVIERLKTRDAVLEWEPSVYSHYCLNTEELKIELDGLVTEAGVIPFLHTRFVAPYVRDGRLEAVIVEDKTGRRAIRASCFVDATGDGDLLARMGLPVRTPDHLQPATTCAILSGMDEVRRQNPGFNLRKAVFDPRYPKALKPGFCWDAPVPAIEGGVMVAGTRAHGRNCADADDLTAAEIEGRRQVRAICDIAREHGPVSLAALPAYIGVRETRHAECLHRLTETEVLEGERFADAIANGSYRVDVHLDDRDGVAFRFLDGTEVLAGADGSQQAGRWRPQREEDPTFYQIPYRSLVPQGAENVLVAGRLIDADRGAYGAARVMVNCNQTGEAAGVAACLAVESTVPAGEVDTDRLRAVLAGGGSVII